MAWRLDMPALTVLFCISLAATFSIADTNSQPRETTNSFSKTEVLTNIGTALAAYPETFSLRPLYKKFNLDVMNQLDIGKCMIYAGLDPLEFCLSLRGTNIHLADNMWSLNSYVENGNYKSGNLFAQIKRGYTVIEKDAFGRHHTATYANATIRCFNPDIPAICSSVMASNPVTLCIKCDKTLRLTAGETRRIGSTVRTTPIIEPWKDDYTKGHAVVIVGFVVDKDAPGGGMFEIRNTWGRLWGDEGYAYLTFDLFAEKYQLAFSITPGTR